MPETAVRYADMTREQRAAHNRERNKIRCNGCTSWWTGLSACHCAGCHRTFSSISAFDKHRDGSHVKGTRHCVDPATLRSKKTGEALLVLVDKGWACWSVPGTYDGPYEEDDSG